MHFKAYLSMALIVALVYLTSGATAATYTNYPGMRAPSGHPNTLPSGKTDVGRTKRWIDFTATALTHFVDAAVPRQARANWSALGLDNTEVFKVKNGILCSAFYMISYFFTSYYLKSQIHGTFLCV